MNAPCPSFPCYSTAHQYFIKFSFNAAMQKVKLNAPWCHKVVCSHLGKVKQVTTGALINIKYHYSRVISS